MFYSSRIYRVTISNDNFKNYMKNNLCIIKSTVRRISTNLGIYLTLTVVILGHFVGILFSKKHYIYNIIIDINVSCKCETHPSMSGTSWRSLVATSSLSSKEAPAWILRAIGRPTPAVTARTRATRTSTFCRRPSLNPGMQLPSGQRIIEHYNRIL